MQKNIQQLLLKKCSICLVCSVPDVTFTSFQMFFDMLYYPLSPPASPHPNCFWHFHCMWVMDFKGDLFACVTATFIMLHFFFVFCFWFFLCTSFAGCQNQLVLLAKV
jgi:hypothetical protein